jgi:hypothetical protein
VKQAGKLILSKLSTLAEVRYRRTPISPTDEMPPLPPGGEVATLKLPEKYQLLQNYPNPFNPSTEIRFAIPEAGFVTLKVYDVLGREVAALMNEEKQPGEYSIRWDARDVPSGIYTCRITAREFSNIMKMILVK